MNPAQPSAPRCHNCGVEIVWQPAIHQSNCYCCGGCAQGGPCYCSYDISTLDRALTPFPGPPSGRSEVTALNRART